MLRLQLLTLLWVIGLGHLLLLVGEVLSGLLLLLLLLLLTSHIVVLLHQGLDWLESSLNLGRDKLAPLALLVLLLLNWWQVPLWHMNGRRWPIVGCHVGRRPLLLLLLLLLSTLWRRRTHECRCHAVREAGDLIVGGLLSTNDLFGRSLPIGIGINVLLRVVLHHLFARFQSEMYFVRKIAIRFHYKKMSQNTMY